MTDNTGRMIQLLEKEYSSAKTGLKFATPFQLLVATILSAQTTDATVNRITPALFKKYKSPLEFAGAPLKNIKEAVKSVNFFNNKASNIKKLSEILVKKYNGKIPDTMEELVELPGVARKTANVVLSQAFGKAEGIVVDTHVKRLSLRTGLSKNKTPEKIERDLMKIVPRAKWISFPFALILHGRAVCGAKKPLCGKCIIVNLCSYTEKTKC
jgi:endonuclease-3